MWTPWAFVAPVEMISAGTVFRNADGEIVGGSVGGVGPLQPDQPTQARVDTFMEIPDASTVEVYVLPDA